jgi:hypothetical protein
MAAMTIGVWGDGSGRPAFRPSEATRWTRTGDGNPGMRGISVALRVRDGGGRDRASGPGFNIVASDCRPRGLNRPLPDSRSAESGTIHASLNPRAPARTIGPLANSAGATPALALQRRARDRRSTLGSRAP